MGTSHTGIRPPASGSDPALAQGLLGADVEAAEDGTWRIARILPGESSVIGARSPLAAPGVAAAPGDLIARGGRRPVDPDLGPNALLVGKADHPVELTLRRDGADRRVSWFRWRASTRSATTIWSRCRRPDCPFGMPIDPGLHRYQSVPHGGSRT